MRVSVKLSDIQEQLTKLSDYQSTIYTIADKRLSEWMDPKKEKKKGGGKKKQAKSPAHGKTARKGVPSGDKTEPDWDSEAEQDRGETNRDRDFEAEQDRGETKRDRDFEAEPGGGETNWDRDSEAEQDRDETNRVRGGAGQNRDAAGQKRAGADRDGRMLTKTSREQDAAPGRTARRLNVSAVSGAAPRTVDLKEAVAWAEILGEPVSKRRRRMRSLNSKQEQR